MTGRRSRSGGQVDKQDQGDAEQPKADDDRANRGGSVTQRIAAATPANRASGTRK